MLCLEIPVKFKKISFSKDCLSSDEIGCGRYRVKTVVGSCQFCFLNAFWYLCIMHQLRFFRMTWTSLEWLQYHFGMSYMAHIDLTFLWVIELLILLELVTFLNFIFNIAELCAVIFVQFTRKHELHLFGYTHQPISRFSLTKPVMCRAILILDSPSKLSYNAEKWAH